MVHGRPLQLVEVVPDQKLLFHQETLRSVVTLCGDFPLAIYTVAGEYRKGKTTILNIFLAFLHFMELKQDWKQHKDVQLTGFEARGGSVRVTNGIWVWSKPFFSTDRSGKKIAIILMDTQGTFDQDTSSAVNSFIFGFSLAVSSNLMYNNMKQISSHDVDSLITFGMTFIPIIGQFQTLSFLVRDWDDEERFPHGWGGGDMMINDLVNPKAGVDAKLSEARSSIKDMFQSVTGFLLPRPGSKIERAKRNQLSIGDMDSDFERYVDELCQEIFVRNVRWFEHKGKEMNGDDWLTIFDHLIKAYEEGKVMDPGFHKDAFTGSSAKTIKDEIVANYQREMLEAIATETSESGLTYVTEAFLKGSDSRIRQNVMELFTERTAHFGRQDAIEAQLVKEVSQWYSDCKEENARAMADHEKIVEGREKLKAEQELRERQGKELAAKMDQMRIESQAQIANAMMISKEEADRVRMECYSRETALAQSMEQNAAILRDVIAKQDQERAQERQQFQAVIQKRDEQLENMATRLKKQEDRWCTIQ